MSRFAHLHQLLLIDGTPVGTAYAVGLSWGGGVDDLPAGWDGAVEAAMACDQPDAACALAVTVLPPHRGRGLSRVLLAGLKDAARAAGLRRFVVPVRPPTKALSPREPMERWMAGANDPWLRTHRRAGGRVLGIAERSMVVEAPVEDWSRWAGRPLGDGDHELAGALSPVTVRAGQGTYVEPNVWVEHPL